MNSLLSYGSDSEESGNEKFTDHQGTSSRNNRKTGTSTQQDVNYDEVGMDLSEVSPPFSSQDSDKEQPKRQDDRENHREDRRNVPERDNKGSFGLPLNREERRRNDDRRDRDEDRYRSRRDEREDRCREKNRHGDDKDVERPRDRYREDRRDNKREERGFRDRRDRRRSRSRDRRRSRSPKRSRSKSKERGPRGFSRRYERANNKMDKLDKMGIEIKTPDCQYVTPGDLKNSMVEESQNKDRFFMPGITGRFRDQIEKRKMLWQKAKELEKKPEVATVVVNNGASGSGGINRAAKVYEATSFADDKTSSKFKRLMGIRGSNDGAPKSATDVLKKQEEMFSSMEQQYEVARTATHTMRGVGLGFGSFQR